MESVSFLQCWIIPFVLLLCSDIGGSQTTVSSVENKEQCVQEFLEWCQKNDYPSGDSGVSVLSVSFYDNGQNSRVFCTVDSDGTECLKNKSPWFHCYPNKTLEYKGKPLLANSEVDDDICSSKSSALKFGYQTEFNRTLFEQQFNTSMEHFYDEMANLHKQMQMLNKHLFNENFPFGNNSPFNDKFPFNDNFPFPFSGGESARDRKNNSNRNRELENV